MELLFPVRLDTAAAQLRSVERVLKATADTVPGDRARWLVEHGRRLDEQAEQADP